MHKLSFSNLGLKKLCHFVCHFMIVPFSEAFQPVLMRLSPSRFRRFFTSGGSKRLSEPPPYTIYSEHLLHHWKLLGFGLGWWQWLNAWKVEHLKLWVRTSWWETREETLGWTIWKFDLNQAQWNTKEVKPFFSSSFLFWGPACPVLILVIWWSGF